MLHWYVALAGTLAGIPLTLADTARTMKGGQMPRRAAKMPPEAAAVPPRRAAPRRRHTEPCFMERNRTDVATLETLGLRLRTRQCATRQCACALRYASVLCFVPMLALARLGFAISLPVSAS